MALRLAIANLKGGVGKSTTTLFLSETLALFHDLRILVVDLDPQSNTSFMLLSRDGLENAEAMGRTLPHFLLALEQGSTASLQAYICGQASDLVELKAKGKRGRVDLLPSVPRLWFVETLLEKHYYLQNVDPGAELRLALSTHLDPLDAWYDLIIFDCPPGFSALTRAGVLGADVIISPTIADAVSLRSLTDFVDIGLAQVLQIKKSLPHFVIISKYQANATDPVEVDRLKKRHDVLEPPVVLTKVMTKATARARSDSVRTYKEKYGRLEADIRLLTDRIFRYAIAKNMGGRS